MTSEKKDIVKDGKGRIKSFAELLKELLDHPGATREVKNTIKNVNLDFEFDEVDIAKKIIRVLEPTLNIDWNLKFKSFEPFDQLLANTKVDETNDSSEISKQNLISHLEFSFGIIKAIANRFSGLAELLVLKFKNNLIKCICANTPEHLRNEASLICERIMERTKFAEEDVEGSTLKWMSVYLWVIKCALKEASTKSEVKRVWAMHKLLNRYSLPENSPIFDLLKATVVSINFLQYKEGRQHIAHILSLNKALIVPLHAKIKAALPTLVAKSKSIACSYGEIFNMAWTSAIPDVRLVLEEEIFQRWMELYLKLDRPKGLSQGPIGKTVFRILSYLHNSRRLLQLSSAITRLYQPILWRSLKSHHPLERCNAAELFLDVFPMEKPESNIMENSNFKEIQMKQIIELLKDESYVTRIVAIRGVVLVFKRRVECLPNAQCREILSWLANELANDGSSYLVRVAVWEFFCSLASSDDPPEFLISLLPQMTNHFHDSSEQVRKAFTTMLLHISENKQLTITYTDVAPMSHIIARLALEGEAVGKLLSKLVMKTVYTEGMEVIEFIKHLKRLIMQCPQAAENLFRWSNHILSVKNANFVIMAILVYLRSFTKQRVESRPDGSGKCTTMKKNEKEEKQLDSDLNKNDSEPFNSLDIENVPAAANSIVNESPSSSPLKKKIKKSKLNPSVQISDKNKEEKFDIDGPTAEIHAHLLGCAHTTWLVFSKQFACFPAVINELNNVLTVCLQNYLRCYKGTPAWYASLTLASLVPLTKLSENTTASSSCLAELRHTEVCTPLSHIEALVYTLTAWNRGYEIIELAIDYIDPAFKLFHLNSSIFMSNTDGGRGRRKIVRFKKAGGKEQIGLQLLSVLFYDYHNETRLLLKHYDQVHEVYNYLQGIKIILEARMGDGLNEESIEILTDTFINDCFELMLTLVPVLHQTEPHPESATSFVATQHMCNLLEWASRVLIPQLKDVESIEVDSDENEVNEEENNKNCNTAKKKKKSKKKKKLLKEFKEDLAVSCLKALLKKTTYMVKIKIIDSNHAVASTKFAIALLKSDCKYWFLEGSLALVEGLAEHAAAWMPQDEYELLSSVCPSLHSQILFSLTSNSQLNQNILHRYKCDIGYLRRKLLVFPNTLVALYGTQSEKFINIFNRILEGCVTAVYSAAVKLEVIDTANKVEDLPLAASMVTQALFTKPKLVSLILSSVLAIAIDNKQDGVLLVCNISYLFTLLKTYRNKFDRADIVSTIQSLYKMILAVPQPQNNENHCNENENEKELDSFYLDPLEKLDTQHIGVALLKNIAEDIEYELVSSDSNKRDKIS